MQNNIFKGLFVGQNFVHLRETDSTNNYLRKSFTNSKPLPEGTVIMADYQSAGRGQQSSTWFSEPGKNILASVLFYPSFLSVQNQFDLNRAVSLALCETLERISESKIFIKWPNDLFINDRKLCGMLIENTLNASQIKNSVVGFGINVNQEKFDGGAGTPISLKQVTGRDFDRLELLGELCNALEAKYLQLRSGKMSELRAQFDKRLFRCNEKQIFSVDGQSIEAKIISTSPEGLLEVETATGTRLFNFKEIAYVL